MPTCKQGDIARIVGVPDMLCELRDHFVTCVSMFVESDEVSWVIDKPIVFAFRGRGRHRITGEQFKPGDRVKVESIPDKYLQPIRGEGGSDETVRDILNELAPRRQVEYTR